MLGLGWLLVGCFSEPVSPHQAVELLIKARQQNHTVELKKAESLIQNFGAEAVPELIRLFSHPDPGIQAAGVYELRELGPLAIPGLLTSLKSGDLTVQKNCVWTLELINSPHVVPALLPLLSDRDVTLRVRTARAIAILGDNRGYAFLINTLADPNKDVRTLAIVQLSELDDPRNLIPLIEKLADPDPFVRMSAIDALSRLGDARAVPTLDTIRQEDTSWQVRRTAAAALTVITGRPTTYINQDGRATSP